MKHKSLILSCVMIFCLVFSANAAYNIALEATDGNTVQTVFTPGSDLYLNINLAEGSGGVAGCAFTLTYPADLLTAPVTNPSNLPDSPSSADITSIFPFMTAGKYTRCENSATAGEIKFAGAEITAEGGSKVHPYDVTLFTVKFTVKDTATGDVKFDLMQTTLNNPEAGWNGEEGVPVIVGAVPNTDAAFGGDDLSDDFPVLLENFATNPTLTVSTGVSNPYEEWKTSDGANWAEANAAIGGPTEDYDNDGFTNDQERLNGSDPTADTGDVTNVDVTDPATWTSIGTNYDATKDFRVANLDVDGNGTALVGEDGLMVYRYMFDARGDALISNAIGAGCDRCDAPSIEAYIDAVDEAVYDIDGSGKPTVGEDGLLIYRYMFDARGDALIQDAVDTDYCTRCTAEEIETYIKKLFPATD